MGQYYKAVNLDQKQYVEPWAIKYNWTGSDGKTIKMGNGAKLMEHSYLGNDFMGAVENLLIPRGAWYNNRIVWTGDYADEEPGDHRNLYGIVDNDKLWRMVTPRKRKIDYSINRFLCNHDAKEYVDLFQIWERRTKGNENPTERAQWWPINPLSLLTAEGNGRGGGDFHDEGSDPRVGAWARAHISIEPSIPYGYTAIDGVFIE